MIVIFFLSFRGCEGDHSSSLGSSGAKERCYVSSQWWALRWGPHWRLVDCPWWRNAYAPAFLAAPAQGTHYWSKFIWNDGSFFSDLLYRSISHLYHDVFLNKASTDFLLGESWVEGTESKIWQYNIIVYFFSCPNVHGNGIKNQNSVWTASWTNKVVVYTCIELHLMRNETLVGMLLQENYQRWCEAELLLPSRSWLFSNNRMCWSFISFKLHQFASTSHFYFLKNDICFVEV